ncbi:MAG: hypothetical protein E7018_06105 [Alphaproteobacteria bacterium]|nr:hypothetical protein [Alphaproteobacteria bacterium]
MRFYYLIWAFVCFLTCGCVRADDEGAAPGHFLISKKEKGKQYWGAIKSKYVTPFGNRAYLRVDDSELESCCGGICCEYDRVEYKDIGPEKMYVAYKGSDAYYFDKNFFPIARHEPVIKAQFVKKGKNLCFGNGYEYKFYTQKGVYTRSVGPYEDVFVGFYGYGIKENGKWGFFQGRHDVTYGRKEKFVQNVPCLYDELIETVRSDGYHLVLARSGNKWKAIDKDGKEVALSSSFLKRAATGVKKNSAEVCGTYHY